MNVTLQFTSTLSFVGDWQPSRAASLFSRPSNALVRGLDYAGRWEEPGAILELQTETCSLLVNRHIRQGTKLFIVTHPRTTQDYKGPLPQLAMRGTVLNAERQCSGPYRVEVGLSLYRFL
jgi:hypothetical protein